MVVVFISRWKAEQLQSPCSFFSGCERWKQEWIAVWWTAVLLNPVVLKLLKKCCYGEVCTRLWLTKLEADRSRDAQAQWMKYDHNTVQGDVRLCPWRASCHLLPENYCSHINNTNFSKKLLITLYLWLKTVSLPFKQSYSVTNCLFLQQE